MQVNHNELRRSAKTLNSWCIPEILSIVALLYLLFMLCGWYMSHSDEILKMNIHIIQNNLDRDYLSMSAGALSGFWAAMASIAGGITTSVVSMFKTFQDRRE